MNHYNIQKHTIYYAGLLIGAWLLGLAGESIYGSAMPAIASDLSTSEALVKQTITFFIFGKTVSMFVCSPIAEAFGRRQFVLFGLFLFIIGGLICSFSPDIYILLAGRLLQGIGCSITILMGRAIVNDSFESGYAAKVFSYIFTGNAIGIFILPIFGGYMATYLNWRWIFLILTCYGSLMFALMWWFLPQTNAKTYFKSLQPSVIWQNYKTITTHRMFWGFLLCVAFMMAGEKAYTTSAAFLLIKQAGLSKVVYGYLTAFLWGAHLSGTLLAGWLSFKSGIDRASTVGVGLITVSGALMLISSLLGWENIYGFTALMFIYMFGTGFIIVSAAVGIVRPFPNLIGFATAFAMALEFGIASVASYIVSQHSASVIPVARAIGILGILTFLSWVLLLKNNKPIINYARKNTTRA